MRSRERLPIDSALEDIGSVLEKHRSLIFIASPGSGKSTRLPAYLSLDKGLRTLVLEPRKSAVKSLADRVCWERQATLGSEVGYQVRFENRSSDKTRLKFVTEALLLREIERDPALQSWDLIILDEFHERSLYCDIGLPLLLEAQVLNPKLQWIIMSATLQKDWLASKVDAPIFELPQVLHPLKEVFVGGAQLELKTERLPQQVRDVLKQHFVPQGSGDALVFLPGVPEIIDCKNVLMSDPSLSAFELCELHGQLPLNNQASILRDDSTRRARRIVLSTNLAESAVTVPRVNCVIDSGLEKRIRFNPDLRLERLELSRISRASATQRGGRAARLGPGTVYRLWSSTEHLQLEEQRRPEIHDSDLTDTLVRLRHLGHPQARLFPWLEAPPERHLQSAENFLATIPKFDFHRALQHPFEFRFGACLEKLDSAGFGIEARVFAFVISETQLQGVSLDEAMNSQFRNPPPALERILDRYPERTSRLEPFESWGELIIDFFFDRVFFRKNPQEGILVGGRGVLLNETLDPGPDQFAVAWGLREVKRHDGLWARASAVERIPRDWLMRSPLTASVRRVDLSHTPPRVKVQKCYLDLGLEKEQTSSRTATDERAWLKHQLRWKNFKDSPEGQWLQRKWTCAQKPWEWPLESEWDSWVEAADFEVSFSGEDPAQTARQEWIELYLPEFDSSRDWKKLFREFPDYWTFPNGRRVRLNYTFDGQIKLESRIQDFYGIQKTPRLGHQTLTLVLLNPARRPIQITQDIASFWSTSYPQLHRQLKMDYPKHLWPEDPIQGF